MFWTEGRFSWPLIVAVAYATIVIVATDIAWRLIQAPLAWIAGGGAAALAFGMAVIFAAAARLRP